MLWLIILSVKLKESFLIALNHFEKSEICGLLKSVSMKQKTYKRILVIPNDKCLLIEYNINNVKMYTRKL